MDIKKDNATKLAVFVTVLIAVIITVTIYNQKKIENTRYDLPAAEPNAKIDSVYDNMVSPLESLESYEGKYASNSGFLNNQIILQRLKVLIGEEKVQILKSYWNTESPIVLDNQILIATGCEAHNCSQTNFIILIDIKNDIFYAGIKIDGRVEVFSENGINLKELNEWRVENQKKEESEIIPADGFSSLDNYYRGVSSENFDAHNYFSPLVAQYITLKNVSPDQINKSFEHDMKEYKNQEFEYDTSEFILDYTDDGIRYYSFLLKCKCFRNSKQLNQESEIRTEVGFDKEGKIYSLKYPKVEYSRYY